MPVDLDQLRRARPDLADLPLAEVAFPGPLRDRLVAAYLDGTKTAGSCLWREYQLEDASLPAVGSRSLMLDSALLAVAVVAVTDVRRMRMGEVDDRIAHDEGEGFASAAEWRAAHVDFWTSPELRGAIGDPAFVPDDDTEVVVEWVEVVERLSRRRGVGRRRSEW